MLVMGVSKQQEKHGPDTVELTVYFRVDNATMEYYMLR